ncbi:hypothetical protein [Moraxella bovis]|uniref:hypothetical protein n=1 Tax=Moraxella bovis TaxID=476 RepID=UPI0013C355E6|nr:hypothetical protein [Moraxella bovis]
MYRQAQNPKKTCQTIRLVLNAKDRSNEPKASLRKANIIGAVLAGMINKTPAITQ